MLEKDRFDNIIKAIYNKAAEILPKGSRVALYGSRARGDARKDSDWDIHIIIPGEEVLSPTKWDEYGWPFEQLGWEFNEWFTPRVYSLAGWVKRNFLPFYENVEKDKLIIFQS